MKICPFSMASSSGERNNICICVNNCALFDKKSEKCSIKIIAESLLKSSPEKQLQKNK